MDSIRPDGIDRPHPNRFGPARNGYVEAMTAHAMALDLDSGGYLDPTSGLFVMTSKYLADRGWCCNQECRHCPWYCPQP